MNCANCGKPIATNTSVTEDKYHFCNSICRYEWRKRGRPTPFAAGSATASPGNVAVRELDFAIEPPGFQNRQMRLRLSYFVRPKIFLDGAVLTPVSSSFLKRTGEYSAVSNFGKPVTICLKGRTFDQVPEMEIDGQRFLIARALTGWEQAWIALPVLLIFIYGGGALAGAIAMAAIFSNSILMRRIGHWLPRYVLTGGTTLMAFLILFRITSAVSPLLESWTGVKIGRPDVIQLADVAREINKRCPSMIDGDTRLDSLSAGPGNVLTYNYTLVKRSVSELNAEQLKTFVRPNISNNARTNPDMKSLRDLQVSFAYRYSDKNGKPVFDLLLTPPEYR